MRNDNDLLSGTLKDYRMALNTLENRLKQEVDFLDLVQEFKRIDQ